MERFSKQHVEQVARDFAAGNQARAWSFFGPEIQRAIIDSVIMAQVWFASVAGDQRPFTAEDIIAFRDAVIKRLAQGVTPANSRMPKCAFEIG